MTRTQKTGFAQTIGAAVALAILIPGAWAMSQGSEVAHDFKADREETLKFMKWYDEIELTEEQEAIRFEALDAIPAACCSNFSAATCCCECNMSRAIWGLSKHLIVNEGYDAEQVRAAVTEWYQTTNPSGFSGDSCFTGGCMRPMAENGCGGMQKHNLID